MKHIFYKLTFLIATVFGFADTINAQDYPFSLPETITASLNVETNVTEEFKNTLLGYNIEGFNSNTEKEFIKLVDPVTIRFPHGVWANFYEYEDDTYQQDSYDNGDHQTTLDTYVSKVKGHIAGIEALNSDKKAVNGGKGYDMMWTYSINFDDGAASVDRATRDMARGLEVKDIELGNEHFWKNQRSNRTATAADYLREATAVSAALKTAYPDIRVSIPLGWRRNQAGYNSAIVGDGNYYDAITVHKYLGADPDIPNESDNAYTSLLTAKLELADDVNWVRNNYGPDKPIWLTEWGVSAGSDVHGAACLGMADAYLYMAENQHVFDRANWFSFNRVLNAMVVVGSNRQPEYPLKKRGYLSSYQILQDVFRDATLLKGTVTSSTQLITDKGSVNAVNARAATKDGLTSIVAINLSNKPVEFTLKFDNVIYSGAFKHKALVFENVGQVDAIDYDEDALELIKLGNGTIILPPLSISNISNITLDPSIVQISGTIEAEDYKLGGQGIGYSDTTSDNTLSDGVDTDGVDVGLFNTVSYVGHTENGEWLAYDINVLQHGNYDFEFIYAAAATGAKLSVEIDGVLLFVNHTLAQTSGATSFETSLEEKIALTEGIHELKINIQNAGFNLDKLNITYVGPPAPPVFVRPSNGTVVDPGTDVEIEASTTIDASEITKIELFINNVSVRAITEAPFTWGHDGQSDSLLENLDTGTYTLKLVLTNNREDTSEASIKIESELIVLEPFGGSFHQIPGTIQIEDYDIGGEGLAFHDSSVGNSGGEYRTSSGEDVDLTSGGTGIISTAVFGNEFTRYSVNVTEEGSYHMIVGYKTSASSSKAFSAYILPSDLSSSTELFTAPSGSTNSGIVKIGASAKFEEYNSPNFDLVAGDFVLELKIPNGAAGPNYDYVTLVRDGDLSVGDLSLQPNKLVVYPVPSKDGVFYLSKHAHWKVYSLLGVEVLAGKGNTVTISSLAKGMYFLRTEKGFDKTLLYK